MRGRPGNAITVVLNRSNLSCVFSIAQLKILPRLLPIALLFGMLGCKETKPNEVIGTWILTDQSRQDLPHDLQKVSARVVVNADGSFVAFDLPEGLEPVPPNYMKPPMRLDSGSGVWKLASWQGREHLQLDFEAFAPSDHESHGPYGFPLIVSRGWSAISLSYSLDDPDHRTVEFEKKK
ncbi:MAG TPA: hypothetical protein VKR82_03915 [Candidatus Acidoferrales bacterium]|nr:hypothetical protein [Candidatus Acidoferrales bacterium]